MRTEPFLCIDGVEVANALRTLTYLRRGLAGRNFEVELAGDLVPGVDRYVFVDDYLDIYDDEYGRQVLVHEDGYTPINLRCYCSAYDEGPYVDPETDDAPWFSAGRSDSGEFLGLVPLIMEVRPTLARGVAHGTFGAAVGPPRAGGLIMEVTAAMYAENARGMAFGERWLAEVLAGSLCGGDASAVILPACPADDDDPMWRTLPHVGLIDGPVVTDVQGVPACNMREVTFQIASESPFLLAEPVVVIANQPISGSTAQSYEATTEEWVGDGGLRMRFLAGYNSPLTLRCSAGPAPDGCPSPWPASCWDWSATIPAGHELIVDGVERTAIVRNPATEEIIGGLDYLGYSGLFHWPEVGPCSTVCVTVAPSGAPAGSLLSIDLVGREL